MSRTTMSVATEGPPELVISTVNTTVSPALAFATSAVFDTARSAKPVTVILVVPELLLRFGSTPPGTVASALLSTVPVAPAATLTVTVYVTMLPAGRLRVSDMLPDPDVLPAAPPVCVDVKLAVS